MENAVSQLGFDVQALWITLGTIVALGAVSLLVMQLIKLFRELRDPQLLNERTIRDKLQNDHERLSKLEASTERQEKELKLLLRSQLVMVHHSIDGNSVDNLREMLKQIEEYLIFGSTRE